ncbi:MAG: exodeoxyribonuclease VII large subunit, partial [Crocinitomicaceae bacterium]
AIAEFPLPILTGIGHSTNLTVAEMISFRNAITPTKLAEFLIQTYREFDIQIKDLQTKLFSIAKNNLQITRNNFTASIRLFKSILSATIEQNLRQLTNEQNRFERSVQFNIKKHENTLNQFRVTFGYLAKNNHQRQELKLHELNNNLQQQIRQTTDRSANQLTVLENKVQMLDPMNVLKRGFSLTTFGGKIIKEGNLPEKGDLIQTQTAVGKINSKVEGSSA